MNPSDLVRRHAHALPFGAELLPRREGTRFRLWAPDAQRVELAIAGADGSEVHHAMAAQDDGWHQLDLAGAGVGTRYRYRLDGELVMPDPASRFNPEGVHGASVVVDPSAYAWYDARWRGRFWHEAVIYELHVGSFTEPGTFAAAAERLAGLAALGITAVELMPLAQFAGRHGWGYDGVLPFAPHAAYGTPEELKSFVDQAHALGLMVLLDVVYNHFGPEGNYLHDGCDAFFNPAHATPWGAAINFDGPRNRAVRDFFVHNALYWVEEFRFDGLRLDAVHAIHDDSEPHIVSEIATALQAGPGRARQIHLVLENERNEAHRLMRGADGRPLVATAQWNDDLHHAAHVLLTGETDGYYADYADAPLARLGRCLAEGYAYQGEPSALRGGVAHGEPSAHLPATAFVAFLQNHDQVGNRAFGERLGALADDPGLLEAMYACLLLSPQIPMLFMGEEFGATTPFLYFCDYEGPLAAAVAAGRRLEFKRFSAFRNKAARARIPDPNACATFMASKLPWAQRQLATHRDRLALIERLLALRRQRLTPHLPGSSGGGCYAVEGSVLRIDWPLAGGAQWQMVANLGLQSAAVAEATEAGWQQAHPSRAADPARLDGGAVRVRLLEPGGG